MRRFVLFLSLICLLWVPLSCVLTKRADKPEASVIHVKSDAVPSGDGESWDTAFSSLQEAIHSARSGDQIWVAQGVYYPTDGADRDISFAMIENVEMYGGFKGSETQVSQRDWQKHPTILSGDIGEKGVQEDNSRHVVKGASNALLDGFIIEDGYAMKDGAPHKRDSKNRKDGEAPEKVGEKPQTHTTPQKIISDASGAGAGLLNFKAAPVVRNTMIRNNAAMKGGGVYNMTNTRGSPREKTESPVFINVTIENNYAFARGGGMSNDLGTHPVIINSIFSNNKCQAKGGALYNDFSCSPVIVNTLFKGNKASRAAAMGNDGCSSPLLVHVTITENTAEDMGAGLYQGSYNDNMAEFRNAPVVLQSKIVNNASETNGLLSISNWGHSWVFAYDSEIDEWNYTGKTVDDKYTDIIKAADAAYKLSADEIQTKYMNVIKSYLPKNVPDDTGGGASGFGIDAELARSMELSDRIFHVKTDGGENANGSSWDNAMGDLQEAINQAHEAGGGQIWVARGAYYPTMSTDRTISFEMREGVAVFGGFRGTETSLSQRDWDKNKTILSGNIGDKEIEKDNSYHVIKGSKNAVLDGFTITGGYADGAMTDGFGGGMFNWGYASSPIVKNATFSGNYAQDGGAVLCFDDVLAYFENIVVTNNRALTGGGISFRFGSSSEIINSTFQNNIAFSRGGAIVVNYGSNVLLSNVSFNKNKTDGNGGAVWVDDQASQYGGTQPVFDSCTFESNQAEFYGGAVHNYNAATSILINNTFKANKAKYGAAIANTLRSQVTLRNNKVRLEDVYTDESSEVISNRQTKRKTGLLRSDRNATKGYVLFSPLTSKQTFLINNEGRIVHEWRSRYTPGNSLYLLEDGSLVRTAHIKNPNFKAGGAGGKIERFSWDGELLWEYELSDATHCLHHDIAVLPNGNILILAWEKKSKEEALASGRNPDDLKENEVWSEYIAEIKPKGKSSADVVWEWHLWDHLIQDDNAEKPHYGDVSEHPEKVNLNFSRKGEADWVHFNSIDYSPESDQIVVSSKNFSEFWVIDHSTSTAEAAGSTGGRYGKGGDLLYRYGNPQAYDSGTDQDKKLYDQHDVQFVQNNSRYRGCFMTFNNGYGRGYSSVDIIRPPRDANGNYIMAKGAKDDKSEVVWSYSDGESFYADHISGAQLLPNGHLFVTIGTEGYMFELDEDCEKVWEFINPVFNMHNNEVFKAIKYTIEFPAFSGKDLSASKPF